MLITLGVHAFLKYTEYRRQNPMNPIRSQFGKTVYSSQDRDFAGRDDVKAAKKSMLARLAGVPSACDR